MTFGPRPKPSLDRAQLEPALPSSAFRAIADELERARSIVLTTHITPDGDGLGAALALLRHLRGHGRNVRLINCSATPSNLRFMVKSGEFSVYHPERHHSVVDEADVILATDIGGANRLGRMEVPVRESGACRIVVDHHLYENDLFDLCLIDPRASSSAELTYDLLETMGAKLTVDIAEPLYIGLVSDTGGFAYQATSPRAHLLAARFLEAGVDPHRVWRDLNCQMSFAKILSLGDCLASLRLEEEGQLVWTAVDKAFLRRNAVPARDVFEVVNHFLHLRGVEVGAFFLEIDASKTKVSLRSSGRVDVSRIADGHGGGGHRYAAGCTVDGCGFAEARDMILAELAEELRYLDPAYGSEEELR